MIAFDSINVHGEGVLGRSVLGGVTHDGTFDGAPVKILRIESPTPESVLKVNRAVRHLIDVYHPNIAQFYGVSWETGTPLCVVTEHAPHGTLAMLLASDTDLGLVRIVCLLLDVARGMLYLHSQPTPLLHRDLRAANIHLMHNFKAKVANFELCGKLGLDTSLVGTPAWTAPEMLRGEKDYTEKIDVYSFSMLMLEILNQRAPYSEAALPPRELLHKVAHEAYRPSLLERDLWPIKLVELMEACWQHDPADRPAFADVVAILDSILSENCERRLGAQANCSDRSGGGWSTAILARPRWTG
ncbi:TKL protein kinase [Saprolegnia parasitica CBS 223.65]|uniref:TKL protein kinase n=1 Tax=Saprolegnia parasitica (strain CBS 223.65) TaxID=695850 RepID=A0A067BVL9_SAPPC|nr:TKL protein kinase [Saprolegnia parasitica CBS 223.65]KDO22308.1 TKL protein kinase [Saprolegnia parasitica CBS 223.65]|eukprot:XP_012206944.1 TKL protein kinase [Saprolegnia parasitica CBS 223.65]